MYHPARIDRDEPPGRVEMDTTAEQPEAPTEPPERANRRTRWIAAGAAGAVVAIGIGLAIVLSKDEELGDLALSGGRMLDHEVGVTGHTRRQPYGPNNSLRKEIWIDAHSRGPGLAA